MIGQEPPPGGERLAHPVVGQAASRLTAHNYSHAARVLTATFGAMQVTVLYTAQVRAAVGASSETLQMEPSATIAQLLEVLAARHGEAFRALVLDNDGRTLPSILLSVNDEQILEPCNQVLAEGDEVMLLSAISGG